MIVSYKEEKEYIQTHLKQLTNFSYFELEDYIEDTWFKESEDTIVSIVLKDFKDEDINQLRLLSVSALAALIQHFNIKSTYVLPYTLEYNHQLLGKVGIEKIEEHVYVLHYLVKVNNASFSIKKAAKKLMKIKNPGLLIQTYFKIYYHFYETQDFKQVIEYMNGLQNEVIINEDCSNIAW